MFRKNKKSLTVTEFVVYRYINKYSNVSYRSMKIVDRSSSLFTEFSVCWGVHVIELSDYYFFGMTLLLMLTLFRSVAVSSCSTVIKFVIFIAAHIILPSVANIDNIAMFVLLHQWAVTAEMILRMKSWSETASGKWRSDKGSDEITKIWIRRMKIASLYWNEG